MKLVLASANQGKLRELNSLLAGLPLQVFTQSQMSVEEIAETGLSFVENALIKARHASRQTGLPALADDSGLIVDALNGEPGLHSARYAGLPSNDQANNAKLLAALHQLPASQRRARFYTVIVLLRHENDPQPLICQGQWQGRILEQPCGHQGFGYDPLFFDESLGLTAAQMPAEQKNKYSHRGQALQQLRQQLTVWF